MEAKKIQLLRDSAHPSGMEGVLQVGPHMADMAHNWWVGSAPNLWIEGVRL